MRGNIFIFAVCAQACFYLTLNAEKLDSTHNRAKGNILRTVQKPQAPHFLRKRSNQGDSSTVAAETSRNYIDEMNRLLRESDELNEALRQVHENATTQATNNANGPVGQTFGLLRNVVGHTFNRLANWIALAFVFSPPKTNLDTLAIKIAIITSIIAASKSK